MAIQEIGSVSNRLIDKLLFDVYFPFRYLRISTIALWTQGELCYSGGGARTFAGFTISIHFKWSTLIEADFSAGRIKEGPGCDIWRAHSLSKYSPSLWTSLLVNASVVFDATFSRCNCKSLTSFNPFAAWSSFDWGTRETNFSSHSLSSYQSNLNQSNWSKSSIPLAFA